MVLLFGHDYVGWAKAARDISIGARRCDRRAQADRLLVRSAWARRDRSPAKM